MTLVELDSSLIDKAKKSIEKNLERVAKKQFKDDQAKISAFVAESMGRIQGSTDIKETAKNTDIIIEAIVENLSVKQKFFSSIDDVRESSSILELDAYLIPNSFRLPNRQQSLRATRRQSQSEKLL